MMVLIHRYLQSFEEFYRKLGCTMVSNPRGSRMRHRSGRSLIRDCDRTPRTSKKKENDSCDSTEEEGEKKDEEEVASPVAVRKTERRKAEKEDTKKAEEKKEAEKEPDKKDTEKKDTEKKKEEGKGGRCVHGVKLLMSMSADGSVVHCSHNL